MARVMDGKLVGDPPSDNDLIAKMLDGSRPMSTHTLQIDDDRVQHVRLAYELPATSRRPYAAPISPWALHDGLDDFWVIGKRRDGTEFYLQAQVDYTIDRKERNAVMTENGERLIRTQGLQIEIYAHYASMGGRH